MAQQNENVQNLMGVTMDKVRDMADPKAIIGDPIYTPDGTMIIPVSRVTYGFASGGSDLPTKQPKDSFAGGGGAGITMEPVAFLVIKDGNVRVMQINPHVGTVDKLVDTVPDVIDKVTGIVKGNKGAETSPRAE